MDQITNQPQPEEQKEVAYICEGTCNAQISQEQYDGGLHNCGEKTCTHFGKPLKKVLQREPESAA